LDILKVTAFRPGQARPENAMNQGDIQSQALKKLGYPCFREGVKRIKIILARGKISGGRL